MTLPNRLPTRFRLAALLAAAALSVSLAPSGAAAEEAPTEQPAAAQTAPPNSAGGAALDDNGLPTAPFTIRYSTATDTAFERDPATGDIAMIGSTLGSLLSQAYDIHPKDIVAPELDLTKRFDVLLRTGAEGQLDPKKMLMIGLPKALNLKITAALREGPINRLRPAKDTPQLEPSTREAVRMQLAKNRLEVAATHISELVSFLRWKSPRPVIDESGLDATYDFVLEWDESAGTAAVFHSLNDIGLEIVPDEGSFPVLEVVVAK